MTHAQFCALMIARRAMGDLGQEVLLDDEQFDELVETSRGQATPFNPFSARSRGEFLLNSCNGPTKVRALPSIGSIRAVRDEKTGRVFTVRVGRVCDSGFTGTVLDEKGIGG